VHQDGDAVALERLNALGALVTHEDLHAVAVRNADVLTHDLDLLRVSRRRCGQCERDGNNQPTHGCFLPGCSLWVNSYHRHSTTPTDAGISGAERAGTQNSEAGDAIAIPGLENQSKSLLEG
jgi:hypothetical protein